MRQNQDARKLATVGGADQLSVRGLKPATLLRVKPASRGWDLRVICQSGSSMSSADPVCGFGRFWSLQLRVWPILVLQVRPRSDPGSYRPHDL